MTIQLSCRDVDAFWRTLVTPRFWKQGMRQRLRALSQSPPRRSHHRSCLAGCSGSPCGAISSVVTPPVFCQTQSQWLATVRGRVGYAFDRILLYGTGGAAFGNIQTGLNPPSTFDSTVEAGWTVGAGL